MLNILSLLLAVGHRCTSCLNPPFIEHIPRLLYAPTRRMPFVELMNEVWRVLKPGGIFYSYTPAVPQLAAFWDPTHVNFITEQTFPMYFDEKSLLAKMYGFNGAFIVQNQSWHGAHLASTLLKTKILQS